MPGAAVLTTLAALRGGAGLVTLASTASAIDRIAAAVPCAMFASLPESRSGQLSSRAIEPLIDRLAHADVIVIGPGLGQEDGTARLVRRVVALDKPLVLDADGLNAMAHDPAPLRQRTAATILTPHPGELLRLDRGPMPTTPADRRKRAERLAQSTRSVVVLKGSRSVVTDGERTYLNDTGNPGMATGGSGDVLAGLTAALLAQLGDALPATIAAVRIHGIAGDLAARARSQEAMIAADLLECFGAAFRAYRTDRPRT